jgi:hypothetical protein
MNLKKLCPGVPRNSISDAKCPRIVPPIKYEISDNADERLEFASVAENTCTSKTDVSQPLTIKNWRERGRCVE